MKLPIDVVPNTKPQHFRWFQRMDTIAGIITQECVGPLPAAVEGPVANLIALVKQLQKENKELWERVQASAVPPVMRTPAPAPVPVKGRK